MASSRRRIAITVPRDRQAAIDVAGHRVQRYVEALFVELELGPAPAVELAVGDAPQIAIEQRTVPLALPAGGDAIALGEAIALAIYRCRELLITAPLVDDLWRAWFPAGAGDARPAEALALVRAAVRYGLRASRCKPHVAQTSLTAEPPASIPERVINELLDDPTAGAVELRLGAELHAALTREPPLDGGPPLAASLAVLGDALYRELGIVVRFAPVALDPGLAGDELAVRCNDLSAPAARSAALDDVVVRAHDIIRDAAGSFVSPSLVRLYLLRLASSAGALIDEIDRRFSPGQLASALRALVDERLTILDLRAILEALLEVAGTTTADQARFIVFLPSSALVFPAHERRGPGELDAIAHAECTRIARKRYVTWHYARGSSQFAVYLVAPEIEQLLVATDAASPHDQDRICAAIHGAIGEHVLWQRPVLLTTVDVRRPLAEVVRGVFPELAVVSYSELTVDANIVVLGRIALSA